MIVFDLVCDGESHVFEAWFASSSAYDEQRERGLIACPMCGDTRIAKAVMAPNVGAKGNSRMVEKQAQAEASEPTESVAVQNVPEIPEAMQKMIGQLARAQKKMLEKSKWVGKEFPERARAIHYGESDETTIHGETTPDEAQELIDEGVSVAPLPLPFVPPESQN